MKLSISSKSIIILKGECLRNTVKAPGRPNKKACDCVVIVKKSEQYILIEIKEKPNDRKPILQLLGSTYDVKHCFGPNAKIKRILVYSRGSKEFMDSYGRELRKHKIYMIKCGDKIEIS